MDPLLNSEGEFMEAPSHLQSAVWRYFGFYNESQTQDLDPTSIIGRKRKVWCKLCKSVLTQTSGNTSNMHDHLKRAHDISSLAQSPPMSPTSPGQIYKSDKSMSHTLESHKETQFETDREEIESDPCGEYKDPPPHFRSAVWTHFGIFESKTQNSILYGVRRRQVWCRLCKVILTQTDGNTTNMRFHLKHDHGIGSLSQSPPTSPDPDLPCISPEESMNEQTLPSTSAVWREEKMPHSNEGKFMEPPSHLKSAVWRYFGFYERKTNDTDLEAGSEEGNHLKLKKHFSAQSDVIKMEPELNQPDHEESDTTTLTDINDPRALLCESNNHYNGSRKNKSKGKPITSGSKREVWCKVCKSVFNQLDGSTKGMRDHLKRVHGIYPFSQSHPSSPISETRGLPSADECHKLELQTQGTIRPLESLTEYLLTDDENALPSLLASQSEDAWSDTGEGEYGEPSADIISALSSYFDERRPADPTNEPSGYGYNISQEDKQSWRTEVQTGNMETSVAASNVSDNIMLTDIHDESENIMCELDGDDGGIDHDTQTTADVDCKVWCRLCKSFLSHTDGPTSKRLDHLKRVHGINLLSKTIAIHQAKLKAKTPPDLGIEAAHSLSPASAESLTEEKMSVTSRAGFLEAPVHLKSAVWEYFGYYERKASNSDPVLRDTKTYRRQKYRAHRVKYTSHRHRRKVWCKLCASIFSQIDGSTTHLRDHLRRAHSVSSNAEREQLESESEGMPKFLPSDYARPKDTRAGRYLDAPARLRSAVWDYFGFYEENTAVFEPSSEESEEDDESNSEANEVDEFKSTTSNKKQREVWCKLCRSIFTQIDGSTTSLLKHLKRAHGRDLTLDGGQGHSSFKTGHLLSGYESPLADDDSEFREAPPGLRSAVWEYFGLYERRASLTSNIDNFFNPEENVASKVKQSSQREVWCKLCKTILCQSDGNTSSMRNHLKRTHDMTLDVENESSPSQSTAPNMRASFLDAVKEPTPTQSSASTARVRFLPSGYELLVPPEMPSKIEEKKSIVWKYFAFYRREGSEETLTDYTVCKLCKRMFTYNEYSGTSSMLSHLRRYHSYHDMTLGVENESSPSQSTAPNMGAPFLDAMKEPTPTQSSASTARVRFLPSGYELLVPPEKPSKIEEKKSIVWKYFAFYRREGSEETLTDYTVCKLCKGMFTYNESSGTSSMLKHLRRHHSYHDMTLGVENESSPSQSTAPNMSAPFLDAMKEPTPTQSSASAARVRFLPSGYELVVPPEMPSKIEEKKSIVWKYFAFYRREGSEETLTDYTVCKLCKGMFTYNESSGTSSMLKHLRRYHSYQKATSCQSGVQPKICPEILIRDKFADMTCPSDRCNWPITLDRDGSPPQFCAGCGLFLSLAFMKDMPTGRSCCHMCGKIKERCKNGLSPLFCSRCGSYFSDDQYDVEVGGPSDGDDDVPTVSDEHLRDYKTASVIKKEQPPAQATEEDSCEEDTGDNLITQNCFVKIEKVESRSNSTGDNIEQTAHTCSNCDKSFRSERNFLKHQSYCPNQTSGHMIEATVSQIKGNTIHNENVELFSCDMCYFKTSDGDSMRDHNRIHKFYETHDAAVDENDDDDDEDEDDYENGDEEDSEEDDDSDEDFIAATMKRKDRLHSLVNKIKIDKKRKICDSTFISSKKEKKPPLTRQCPKCKKGFDSLMALKRHAKLDECKETVVKCEHCDYLTKSAKNLRVHIKRIHSSAPVYTCEKCSHRFKSKRGMMEHMNVHTGATPFQCENCGKGFATNSSWYKHKRNKCQKPVRQKFLCPHCGVAVSNLQNHIDSVHLNVRNFPCTHCSKSFTTQYHLVRHERIHTGEKPFGCDYCDYKASQKVVVRSHMRRCAKRVRADAEANINQQCDKDQSGVDMSC